MSRLTRDGTSEPVSRDQILRRERDREMFVVPQTTSRIGNLTRLIHTLPCVMIIHAYIPTVEKGARNYLEDYSPCAGGLSAVNAIDTQSRGLIKSGLTRWQLAVNE